MDTYSWLSQICPICEIPPTKLLGQRGGTAHREGLGLECEIWRCGRCGLIFPHPMPVPFKGMEQHYDMMPSEYFAHYDLETKDKSAQYFLKRAEELTGGKGKLLDIGAGRGELLRAAKQGGWSVVGIEPSAQFREYATRLSEVEVRGEPVEQCGFTQNSFDVVMLAAVLEHLYNPDETIREIAHILRPGGALFVDVPNEAGLYFRVGNLYEKLRGRSWVINLAPTFPPFHVFGYTPRSLRALLAKHGLKPTDWRIYRGRAMVPSRGGPIGVLEQLAAQGITTLSKFGNLGTYIETWAIKVPE